MGFNGEVVTILSPGTVLSPFSGVAAPAWELDDDQEWETEPSEVVVDNVLVASGGTTNVPEVARSAVDSDFDLIFRPPYTTVPTPHDRVIVRDLVCDVVGRPFSWIFAASGTDGGVVCRVSIREG